MDEGVNRKRKALELLESTCVHVFVGAYVSCRFCAGTDVQRRQMGNYQAGDRQAFATVKKKN